MGLILDEKDKEAIEFAKLQLEKCILKDDAMELIDNNYKLNKYFTKDYMIHSKFPFVIDFKDNSFWVCESITCCACAAQREKILTPREFFNKVK